MASNDQGGSKSAAAALFTKSKETGALSPTSVHPASDSKLPSSHVGSTPATSSASSHSKSPKRPSSQAGKVGAPSAKASSPAGGAWVNKESNRKPIVDDVKVTTTSDDGGSVSKPGALHGRRSRRNEASSFFGEDKFVNSHRPADKELDKNVKVVNDGITDREQASREQAERAQQQQQMLAQHTSDLPTGYHAVLPRLSDLDVTNSWNKLLRMMRNEFDMSCLTSCLARELDEDVAWNPEMLLVQLTSDLLDAEELQKDGGEAYVPVDASDIGQMTGGEVTRKRSERGAAAAPATISSPSTGGAAPADGAAGGATHGSVEKSHSVAAAAPTPSSSQPAPSNALPKRSTAAGTAAAPTSKSGGNAANSGSDPTSRSPKPKQSTEGLGSGAVSGGGNHSSHSKSAGGKQQVEKLFEKK